MVLAMLFGLAPRFPNLADESSPLDRLRERSGEVRWQQHRHQWLAPVETDREDSSPESDVREPEPRSSHPSVNSESTRGHRPEPRSPFDPIESAPAATSVPAAEPPHSERAPSAPIEPVPDFDPDDTAPTAANAVAPIPDHAAPTSNSATLQTLPESVWKLLPPHAEVLPLPDFLEGADPLWLAPRLRAAPRLDRSTHSAGLAGSQLLFVQNESVAPIEDRRRGMLRPITDISPFLDYDPDGGDACEYLCPTPSGICDADADHLCPAEEPLPESGSAERFFAHMNYFWAASNVYSNPLYFEDPLLERYGHVHLHEAVQPLYSVARFGGQLIGLPYQMALCPVHDRVYPLGYYRPGDPAPRLIYQPPLNARAGAVAAGVYTGLFFLVP